MKLAWSISFSLVIPLVQVGCFQSREQEPKANRNWISLLFYMPTGSGIKKETDLE